jgi:dipeptidase E
MKLLLTSNGLANESIAKALLDLVGKPASETMIVFIPTAMNMARGDKTWFINDLYNIKKQGFKFIDIVDIAALPEKVWLPRLEKGDVLFFSGGNTFYLMYWLKKTGLLKSLPKLLQTRVYAGISAGSMVTNPSLIFSGADKKEYNKETIGYCDEDALHFVDFYIQPHFNSHKHPLSDKEHIEAIAEKVDKTVYALDNDSAIKVVDDQLEIITEGEYWKF